MLRRASAFAIVSLVVAIGVACNAGYTSNGIIDQETIDARAKDASGDASVLADDGGIGGDTGANAIDGGVDAAVPMCNAGDPFATPTLISELDTTSLEAAPRVTSDELSIVFYTNRVKGGSIWDIFSSQRVSRMDPFDAPVIVSGVSNSTTLDLDPFLSDDGLTIYFSSERGSAMSTDALFVASRSNTTTPFQTASTVAAIGGGTNTLSFIIDSPQKQAYFATGAGAGSYSLYTSTIGASGFSTPQAVTSVDAKGFDTYEVALTGDSLTMFFTSNRAGTVGDEDVWVATRGNVTDPWSDARNVAELNGTGPDQVGSISRDGCRIYYARSSTTGLAGLNSFDLYMAEKRLP